jgi:Ser-tRNA(Ala) deacylase AlaX
MTNTKLIYLEDFNLLASDAKVLEIVQENSKEIVILDQTIFYPQGGGQPYDKGYIEGPSGKFLVEEVRFADGIVKHIGKFEFGSFQIGESVKCAVDEPRRALHSRIHSAGHVVDMAVTALNLNWIPGKGYHFPEGPYVEYAGILDGLDKEKLKTDIENLCNKFVNENWETQFLFMDKEKMKEVCHFVPDYIPEGKPARVVMYGDFGVPCGGTHVSNLSEIKHMTIRKIKSESGNIRVAYDVIR